MPRIAAAPRVKIDTPRLTGSISLKGARIDDLSLVQFRETVDPASPAIVLYSPSGTAEPYYAEFGWVRRRRLHGENSRPEHGLAAGRLRQPDATTPVTLKYDNGEGLTFRRTISIDDRYLFTIKDDVSNVGNAPVTLYPFALISRHGTPKVSGYYILHEGLIGYLGDQGLQQYTYKKIDDAKSVSFKVTDGWLGITDKYWASALLPDTDAQLQARFSSNQVGATHNLPDRLSAGSADHRDRRHRPAPMRGCSPAPRKPALSASIFRWPASAATTSSSRSTTSIS